MAAITIGLLHPGAMGASVGAAAIRGGTNVLWASEGRSAATVARAVDAGCTDVGSTARLVERCTLILSICPPAAAEGVAAAVVSLGFTGTYVDANAIAPQRARAIAAQVTAAGGSYVDGGIIGPPARHAGTTRFYLSGSNADAVAACFDAGPLDARVLGAGIDAASALKMAYAAYTKGTTALLLGILAMAQSAGVDEALAAEWALSQPDLARGAEARVRAAAAKAWRFEGEMREIADTFAAAGLPRGFHDAAAELYSQLAAYRDAEPPPSLDELLRAVLAQSASA